MAEKVDDLFKDFKYEDSDEPPHSDFKKRVQKIFNKHKPKGEEPDYINEIEDLKEQVNELREQIKGSGAQKEKPEIKHVEKPKPAPKSKLFTEPSKSERIVLIGIIVLLSAFIIFDLALYHGSKETKTEENTVKVGLVNVSNKTSVGDKTNITNITNKEIKDQEQSKTINAEETELSGDINIKIDKISKRKVSEDVGYITQVSFTITNGGDEVLKPTVRVYAFDKDLEDTWIDLPRGTFTYSAGIEPGKEQAGSIDLTPKTFRSLSTIKTVILKLSDENDEAITSVIEKFYIE